MSDPHERIRELEAEVARLRHGLDRRLADVARVQQSLLPQRMLEHPRLDMAASYRPSEAAGGDYWDYRDFDDGSIGVVIADVAGHGPAAAVVMAMMRTIMNMHSTLTLPSMDIAQAVNRFLGDGLADGMFVTAFFLRLDPDSGTVLYANAGHCPPRVRRADGTVVVLDEGGTPPIGVLPVIGADGGEVVLAPDDAILLYTDGITEAFAPSGELFGAERLDAVLREPGTVTGDGLVRRVLDAVAAHEGGRARTDDQCVVAVRYVG